MIDLDAIGATPTPKPAAFPHDIAGTGFHGSVVRAALGALREPEAGIPARPLSRAETIQAREV